jgi:hypothetical protein
MHNAGADGQQMSVLAHAFGAEGLDARRAPFEPYCRSSCVAFMQAYASDAIPFGAILR